MLSSLTLARRSPRRSALRKCITTPRITATCFPRLTISFPIYLPQRCSTTYINANIPLRTTATSPRTTQWYLRPNTTHRRVCAQCAQTRFEVFEMKKHFFYRFRFAGKVFEIHSEAELDVDARSALFWETEYFESSETADCVIQVRRAEPPAENSFMKTHSSGCLKAAKAFCSKRLTEPCLNAGKSAQCLLPASAAR